MIEFLVALWSNLKVLCFILGSIGFICTGIVAMYRLSECDDSERPGWWRPIFVASIVAFSLLVIPDIGDLWRARIALIKWNLASPANVQKTVETIERIGKKLECKYLGGESCKE